MDEVYEFKAVFKRNMGRFTFDEFADLLLDNMEDKVRIDGDEVCGHVGLSKHYICVSKDGGYVLVPIDIEGYDTPFYIEIRRVKS